MQIYGKQFPDDSELISKKKLDRYLKNIQDKNLQEKGISLAAISMYERLYKPYIRAFIDGDILIKTGWKEYVATMKED